MEFQFLNNDDEVCDGRLKGFCSFRSRIAAQHWEEFTVSASASQTAAGENEGQSCPEPGPDFVIFHGLTEKSSDVLRRNFTMTKARCLSRLCFPFCSVGLAWMLCLFRA